jgi:hypothetical protein
VGSKGKKDESDNLFKTRGGLSHVEAEI